MKTNKQTKSKMKRCIVRKAKRKQTIFLPNFLKYRKTKQEKEQESYEKNSQIIKLCEKGKHFSRIIIIRKKITIVSFN